MHRLQLHLTDGRVLDLTVSSVDEILDRMRVEGVTREMIASTVHIIALPKDLPTITCPRCGWRSYNIHDVRERYCAHCHLFHDDIARG